MQFTFVKRMMMAGATLLAGYAMKKMLGQLEAQQKQMAERARAAQDASTPQDVKRLKQDPATGVYYAED